MTQFIRMVILYSINKYQKEKLIEHTNTNKRNCLELYVNVNKLFIKILT